MNINGAILRQQIPHQDQTFVNHRDKRVGSTSPRVAIGDLLQKVRLLVERLAADLDVHREVGADVEGRIDVDQLQPARVFNLLAQCAALE